MKDSKEDQEIIQPNIHVIRKSSSELQRYCKPLFPVILTYNVSIT